MKPYRAILIIAIVAIALIWLLPFDGAINIIPAGTQNSTWPRVMFDARTIVPNEPFTVIVEDVTPYANVRLEAPFATVVQPEAAMRLPSAVYQWEFEVTPSADTDQLKFYNDCDDGCQLWTVQRLREGLPSPTPRKKPTKLCVVWPNPERDWHNRQGWVVESTYVQPDTLGWWDIDGLVKRVQVANAQGLNVLVRVDFTESLSVPEPNDYRGLDAYLTYVRRLARDERLSDIHALIIGSNMNTQSPSITPEWYARMLIGSGAEVSRNDNVIQVVRAENAQLRVLVGTLLSWTGDSPEDAPWLSYMDEMVAAIDAGIQLKTAVGVSNAAPDGFAIQADAFVASAELADASLEPLTDLTRPQHPTAQAGFRIYQDWLDAINRYPTTNNAPAYIVATNSYDRPQGIVPTDNYPAGWLTNALAEINNQPQVRTLCWFIDYFPHDENWVFFSLTDPRGQLQLAAEEFDQLLRE